MTGRVVVLGEPEHTAGYIQRIRAWGAEAAHPARPGHAPALVPCAGTGAGVPAGRVRALAAWGCGARGMQPAAGRGAGQRGADQRSGARPIVGDCLAVLPPEVDDGRLFQALHAALAQPEVPASGLPPRHRRASRKVLVAEDNRINQQVIDRMLKSAGHAVTLVDDGGQALDALETDSFDIVLIDVNMPVMNGLDVVKLHRFATGEGEAPPFIALTADATEETRRAM